MKTPYDVLGVAPDADEQAIASAFREAAKACHPDLNPEDRAAEQQFKQVIAARDALKNPEWRALYRFVQLRRQHDRRHWMITLASCVVSAVVSAGLVSLLQKPSISEPLLEDGVSLLAANWNPEADGPHRFELAGSAADPARAQAGEPAQTFNAVEMDAGSRNERDETGDNAGISRPSAWRPPHRPRRQLPRKEYSKATASGRRRRSKASPVANGSAIERRGRISLGSNAAPNLLVLPSPAADRSCSGATRQIQAARCYRCSITRSADCRAQRDRSRLQSTPLAPRKSRGRPMRARTSAGSARSAPA